MTILTLTVLIVEDAPVDRNLMVAALTDSYQLLEADSVAEALAVSNGFESPIDLLIADQSLTMTEFRRLTRQIQLTRPHLKVLRICADIGEESGQQEELIPGISFLERPFLSNELSEKVAQILVVRGFDDKA